MRYFRALPPVYVAICSQLDSAYGYPNAETRTDRALPLLDDLPSDSEGRVYLAISAEYCDYILPSEMLPALLANGDAEEVDRAAYEAAANVAFGIRV